MATFTYLTDAEARTLTRSQLLERIMQQQAYDEAKRRKTPAHEAATDELSRIIHRYLNLNAGFDAAFATLGGYSGSSYWETRPVDDAGASTAPAPWPSSSASPQEQTAAVFARLTPERLAQLYAEADDEAPR